MIYNFVVVHYTAVTAVNFTVFQILHLYCNKVIVKSSCYSCKILVELRFQMVEIK